MTVKRMFMFQLLLVLLIMSVAGCGDNKRVVNSADIKKIISLSPSITGQIIDLGAEDLLVGVTTWHPQLKKTLPIVGTYISPSIEKIIALKPDIIFISEEEGEVQRDYFINKFGQRYYKFGKNRDFNSICLNYIFLGEMLGRRSLAEKKIEYYKSRLAAVKKSGTGLKIAFLVSVKPLVTVSKHSFISGIIEETGAENVYRELITPYPLLTLESLVLKNPDVVFVMFSGDDIFLYNQLKNFRRINFINRKNIFIADENTTPYYSPGEYVKSVEKISVILDQLSYD